MPSFWHEAFADHVHRPFRPSAIRGSNELPRFVIHSASLAKATPAYAEQLRTLSIFAGEHCVMLATPDESNFLDKLGIRGVPVMSFGRPHDTPLRGLIGLTIHVGAALYGSVVSQVDEAYIRQRISSDLTSGELGTISSFWQDGMAGRDVHADAFVTCDKLLIAHRGPLAYALRVWIASPSHALDYLECRLKAADKYLFNPIWSTDRSGYYDARLDSVAPSIARGLATAAASGHPHSADVTQFLISIHTRMRHTAEARDFIAAIYYEPASSNRNDIVIYHFGYLVSLISGIIDNLAWVLAYWALGPEALTLKPTEVDLTGQPGREFRRALRSKGVSTVMDAIQKHQPFLKLVEQLRNRLAHREAAWATGFDNLDKDYGENLVEIHEEIARLMPKGKAEEFFNSWGLAKVGDAWLLEPYRFATRAMTELALAVESALALLFQSAGRSLGTQPSEPEFLIPVERDIP